MSTWSSPTKHTSIYAYQGKGIIPTGVYGIAIYGTDPYGSGVETSYTYQTKH